LDVCHGGKNTELSVCNFHFNLKQYGKRVQIKMSRLHTRRSDGTLTPVLMLDYQAFVLTGRKMG